MESTMYYSPQPKDIYAATGSSKSLYCDVMMNGRSVSSTATGEWQYSYDGIQWQSAADDPDMEITQLLNFAISFVANKPVKKYYRNVATYTADGVTYTATSRAALLYFYNFRELEKSNLLKVCRLRFLNPDGSTAFAVDSDYRNRRSRAFIAQGQISVQRQNGVRRTATVTMDNVDGQFDYDVNHLWYGQEVALDEGFLLPDGTTAYEQQGVFLLQDPKESVTPQGRTMTYALVDKWAYLDGTLGGDLETTYGVPAGSSIYAAISALLAEDRGNGQPIDAVAPVYTTYYDGKTQALPDGTTALLTNAPYTLMVSPGTRASVILGLTGMLNAWVGYDATGALRVEASQDDILDMEKPIAKHFSMNETELLGMTYTAKNTENYNDIIVVGEALDDYEQPAARAQDLNGASPVNVNIIGKKTKRIQAAGYGTQKMCEDRAVWELKRQSVLHRAVDISCAQTLSMNENEIVTIVRTDKPGSPEERHLVVGFTRPLVGTEPMTISAVSVQDMTEATLVPWNS